MPDRPPSFCRACGRQWHPRGPAGRCPACGGRVEEVLSLDDDEPDSPPAAGGVPVLPLVLGCGMFGLAGLAAVAVAAFILWDAGDRPVEQAAAAPKAAAPAPAPQPDRPKPKEGSRPEPEPEPEPKVEPEPKPEPTPKAEPVAKAEPEPPPPEPLRPEPKTEPPAPEVTALPVAPSPRPVHPFPPPRGSWASAWEEAGGVRVRVVGVAVTRVPLLERRKAPLPSPEPYFVVWVEVENTSDRPHAYRRWQPVLTGECTLRYANGPTVGYAVYPPETVREWFADFTQELPPGGPAVLESLVFARPNPANRGDLVLTLDATRVGAAGRYTFTIPRAVWAKV